MFEEWLLEKGVNVLNGRSEWYTFYGPMGHIDATFCNLAVDRMEWGWKVDVSDHNAIRLSMSVEGVRAAGSGRGWSTAGADWEAFGAHLAGEMAVWILDDWERRSTAERL